jgi:hypothetical protein
MTMNSTSDIWISPEFPTLHLQLRLQIVQPKGFIFPFSEVADVGGE